MTVHQHTRTAQPYDGSNMDTAIDGTGLPGLGIPVIKEQDRNPTGTFAQWINATTKADKKTEIARAHAKELTNTWGLDIPQGDTAVICIGRAQWRIKQGAKVARQRQHDPRRKPRATILKAIVHTRRLPTAVKQSEERWYMPGLDRHWSADETCNAFGVAPGSTMRHALTGKIPINTTLSDSEACSMLGDGADIGVQRAVLRIAMSEAGVDGTSDAPVRLAGTCDGIGMMAEAMEQETQGKWEYVRAEEKNRKKREVLTASWAHRGMTAERVRHDAHQTTTAELATAPGSDVYVITPDCGKYSRQSQTDPAIAARETETVATLLQYATAKRPAIVIMESVADLLTSTRMRACGAAIEHHMQRALPDYRWYAQVVDPYRHMDTAMSRERAYWMGIKPVP